MHVQRTVTIRASQDTVFAEWLAHFPDLLDGRPDPEWLDDRRLRWFGPESREPRTVRITEMRPNERIEWESEGANEARATDQLSDAEPWQSGLLSLTQTAESGTELWLKLEYRDDFPDVGDRVDEALETFRERVEVPLHMDQTSDDGAQAEERWRGVGRRAQTEYGAD